MPQITIYQYEISPFSDKVRRVLKLKGLDYDVDEVLISKAKKWKSVSPTLKFPALRYDNKVIVDSTNIISFLDEQHPSPRLIPQDAKSRALTHILEDWADESLYFYDLAIRSKQNNVALLIDDLIRYEKGLTKKIFEYIIPKAANKIAHVQGLGRKDNDTLSQEIRNHFSAINTLLSDSEYLCGPEISIADIAVASMIYVLVRAEEPAAMLPEFGHILAWRKRVDAMTL